MLLKGTVSTISQITLTSLEFDQNNISRTHLGVKIYYIVFKKIDDFWQNIIKNKASGYDIPSQEKEIKLPVNNKVLIMTYSKPNDTLYCELKEQ